MLVALAAVCAGLPRADTRGDVAFPEGYRAWTHVKSGIIDDPKHPAFKRFGGLHHIYANPQAMAGYRSGRFRDGAILVYDLFALRKQDDGTVDQGPRRQIDVMVKDTARFPDTGGWGYEEFAANAPRTPTLTPQARAGCAGCHAARKAQGYVFSDFRE